MTASDAPDKKPSRVLEPGANSGLDLAPAVRVTCTTFLPSLSASQTWFDPPLRSDKNAIWLPSAVKAGAVSEAGPVVTCCAPPGSSAFIFHRWVMPGEFLSDA